MGLPMIGVGGVFSGLLAGPGAVPMIGVGGAFSGLLAGPGAVPMIGVGGVFSGSLAGPGAVPMIGVVQGVWSSTPTAARTFPRTDKGFKAPLAMAPFRTYNIPSFPFFL